MVKKESDGCAVRGSVRILFVNEHALSLAFCHDMLTYFASTLEKRYLF